MLKRNTKLVKFLNKMHFVKNKNDNKNNNKNNNNNVNFTFRLCIPLAMLLWCSSKSNISSLFKF